MVKWIKARLLDLRRWLLCCLRVSADDLYDDIGGCTRYTHIEWRGATTCQCGMVNVTPTHLSEKRWSDILDAFR